MDIDAFAEYQEERAYRRYIDDALAQATRDKEAGLSRYEDIEFAFEELLDEPLTKSSKGQR